MTSTTLSKKTAVMNAKRFTLGPFHSNLCRSTRFKIEGKVLKSAKYATLCFTVMCIDIDLKSNRGITGSAEDKITVFQLTAEKKLEVEKSVQIKNSGISKVKIRGDCKIVATGGWDHK